MSKCTVDQEKKKSELKIKQGLIAKSECNAIK